MWAILVPINLFICCCHDHAYNNFNLRIPRDPVTTYLMHMKIVGDIAPLPPMPHLNLIANYLQCHAIKLSCIILAMIVCDCLLCNACPVVIECMFVDCFSSVSFLCAPADRLGDDSSLRSTTPSEPAFPTGKDSHYL